MASEQEYKAEIDRLRLLLQRMSDNGKRRTKGYLIELEPSPSGFQIIITGISAADEVDGMRSVAALLNALLQGAIRFSLASWSEWPKARERSEEDGDQLRGTLTAMCRTELTPVPPNVLDDGESEQALQDDPVERSVGTSEPITTPDHRLSLQEPRS